MQAKNYYYDYIGFEVNLPILITLILKLRCIAVAGIAIVIPSKIQLECAK